MHPVDELLLDPFRWPWWRIFLAVVAIRCCNALEGIAHDARRTADALEKAAKE